MLQVLLCFVFIDIGVFVEVEGILLKEDLEDEDGQGVDITLHSKRRVARVYFWASIRNGKARLTLRYIRVIGLSKV